MMTKKETGVARAAADPMNTLRQLTAVAGDFRRRSYIASRIRRLVSSAATALARCSYFRGLMPRS